MDKYKQFENSLFEHINKEFSKFSKDSVLILQNVARPYYRYINSFRNYLNIKNLKFDKSLIMALEFSICHRIKTPDFDLLRELYTTVCRLHDLVSTNSTSVDKIVSVMDNYKISDSSSYYHQINIAEIFDTAGFHKKAETDFNCDDNILKHIEDNNYKFYLLEKNYPDQDALLDDVFNISRNESDIILKAFIKAEKTGNYFHLISSNKSLKEICDLYSVNSFDVLNSSSLYFSMLNDNIEITDNGETSLVTGSFIDVEDVSESRLAEISKSDMFILHNQIKELNTIKHKLNNFSINAASTDLSESLLSITETLESVVNKTEMLSFDELFNNFKKFLSDLENEFEVKIMLLTVSEGSNLYKSEEREVISRIIRFIRLIMSFQKDYRSYEFSTLKIRIEVIPSPEFNEIKIMAFEFYDKDDLDNQEFQKQSLSRLHHFVKDICEFTTTSYLNRHNCLLLSFKTENPDVLQSYVVFKSVESQYCINSIFLNQITIADMKNLTKFDNNSRIALETGSTNLPLYFTEEVYKLREFSHEEIPLNEIHGKKIMNIQVHGNEIGIICDTIVNSGKFTSLEIPELIINSIPSVSGFIEYKDNKLLPILKMDYFVSECSTAVIIDLVDSSGFSKEESELNQIIVFEDTGIRLGLEKKYIAEILSVSENLKKIGNGTYFSDGERTYPVVSINGSFNTDETDFTDGYILCIDALTQTFGIFASDIQNFTSKYDIVKPDKFLTNFAEKYIKINESKYMALEPQKIHDYLFSGLKLEYNGD